MSKKARFGITLLIVLFVSSLASAALAAPDNDGPLLPWTGDPDPYDCNGFMDCYDMVTVCIDGKTYEVGIFYDPTTVTEQDLIDDAFAWSEIVLTIGSCPNPGFVYTGRWVHTYFGTTWACSLVSEPGVDKNTPRFSNPEYVDETCGVHEFYGDFVLKGEAEDYLLCREKKWSNDHLGCGNHYDTSTP